MGLDEIKKALRGVDKDLSAGLPSEVARKNLAHAMRMIDEMMRDEKQDAATKLGKLGGTVTAKRGPEYFRELAARRKTHGGGRPRKDAE